jgi:hypothetical protein
MPHWMIAAWGYVWGAISTHPYYAITLALSFLFSLAAFIVSMLSVCAANRQARAAEAQAREAQLSRLQNERALAAQAEEGRKSAETAERSAEASRASAEATKQLVEIGQRPWVNHVGNRSRVATVEGAGMSIEVYSNFVNGGKTPAFDLRMGQWLKIFTGEIPARLDYPSFEIDSTVATLGPTAGCNLPNRIELSQEQYAAIQDGTQILCAYGIAAYSDILGNAHETRWCLSFARDTGTFAYTGQHNAMT